MQTITMSFNDYTQFFFALLWFYPAMRIVEHVFISFLNIPFLMLRRALMPAYLRRLRIIRNRPRPDPYKDCV